MNQDRQTYQSREWLMREYVTNGRTCADIAVEAGVCGSTVHTWLRNCGIKSRVVLRQWTEDEDNVIREFYPIRRIDKAVAALPHRTMDSIHARAQVLGASFVPAKDAPERWCSSCEQWLAMKHFRILPATGKNGHTLPFPSPHCMDCDRGIAWGWKRIKAETDPEWVKRRNAQATKDQMRAYWKDPAKGRAKQKAAHKKYMAISENYRQMTRHKAAQQMAIRRGARAIPDPLTATEWNDILNFYDHSCAYCGCKPARIEIDHVIPVSRGGLHHRSNVVPACRRCNANKNDHLMNEWLEYLKTVDAALYAIVAASTINSIDAHGARKGDENVQEN
jgi:5-methylcytosine-specific restriction endonuclease McrA